HLAPVPRTVGAVTSRGPLALAALASAAVSGLDPSSVEGVVPQGALDPYEGAFVQDPDHHRGVIRAPRTAAASVHLEPAAALLWLGCRRLPLAVPAVQRWVAVPAGARARCRATSPAGGPPPRTSLPVPASRSATAEAWRSWTPSRRASTGGTE